MEDSSPTLADSAREAPESGSTGSLIPDMLSPRMAWRILCQRTGGGISLPTFYRWVNSGRVYSVRLGYHIFIPKSALEDVIKQCLAGERV